MRFDIDTVLFGGFTGAYEPFAGFRIDVVQLICDVVERRLIGYIDDVNRVDDAVLLFRHRCTDRDEFVFRLGIRNRNHHSIRRGRLGRGGFGGRHRDIRHLVRPFADVLAEFSLDRRVPARVEHIPRHRADDESDRDHARPKLHERDEREREYRTEDRDDRIQRNLEIRIVPRRVGFSKDDHREVQKREHDEVEHARRLRE